MLNVRIPNETIKNTVEINSTALKIVEHQGQRVVTLAMMDQVHGRPEGTARRTFNANKERLVEGRHYFKVCADEIRTHKILDISPKSHEDVTLLTERGYLVLVKSFTDDLAWQVQEQLVDGYFRRQEDEAAPSINLRDPKQLAAAALQLIEVNAELQSKVDAQQRQIEEAAPKIEALNRLALADGSLCIRDAAKTLGIQEIKLKRILQERAWIYRRPTGAGWLAYSDKLQSGLMEHKVTTGQKGDGSEWINTQPRVTAKGLTRLVEAVQQGAMH